MKLSDQMLSELQMQREERAANSNGDQIGEGEMAAGRIIAARTGQPVVFVGRTELNRSLVELLDGSRWEWDKAGREKFGPEFWDLVDDIVFVMQAARRDVSI